jgi:hypothetical protein
MESEEDLGREINREMTRMMEEERNLKKIWEER